MTTRLAMFVSIVPALSGAAAALDSDAIARAERQAIANVIKQPVR